MEILQIVGIGIIAAVVIVLIKDIKPEIAIITGVAAGILIFIITVNMLMEIISVFVALIDKTGVSSTAVSAMLKIIGVGYLTEFAQGICEDSGSKSLGDKIVFGGKIIILYLSLPIIRTLFEIITGLL